LLGYSRRCLRTSSVDSLITRGGLGEHVGVYAKRLLSGPLPWMKMRQGYGLVRLCERYGVDKVDALCKRSLAFDVIDVPRLERMLKEAQVAEDAGPAGRLVPLPASRFARDPRPSPPSRSKEVSDGLESTQPRARPGHERPETWPNSAHSPIVSA
jgi:hypothetical protein